MADRSQNNSQWTSSFFSGKYQGKSFIKDVREKCGFGDLRKEVSYETATVRTARMGRREKYNEVPIQC